MQKHTRIQEEDELEGAVSRVAAAVPGVAKTDIHKILSEFTAAKHMNWPPAQGSGFKTAAQLKSWPDWLTSQAPELTLTAVCDMDWPSKQEVVLELKALYAMNQSLEWLDFIE